MAVEAEAYYNNGEFFDTGTLQQQQQQQMMTWQQQGGGVDLGFEFPLMGFYQNELFSYSYSSCNNMLGADVATTTTTNNNNSSSNNNNNNVFLSESLASLIEKQNQEIDWALQIQNQRLRRTIQETSMHHRSILLQKYEPYITALISQKDQIISTSNTKKLILENYVKNMELETDMWQAKALESEAQVAELNNALSQMRERINGGDEESCCERGSTDGDGDKCRICRVQRPCVVLLPCRHLCSCEFCEGFVGVCPVCATVKESSIEVILE